MSGWLLGPRRIGLLLLILFSVVHKSVGQPPPEQVESLIAFFDSTNGASWVNKASWTVGNPCLNSWYGVHCDTLDDKIETLLLSGNNLTGSLPRDLALPDLVELWVVLGSSYCWQSTHTRCSSQEPFFQQTRGNTTGLAWPLQRGENVRVAGPF